MTPSSGFGRTPAARPTRPAARIFTPELPGLTQSAAAVEDQVAYLSKFVPDHDVTVAHIGFDVIVASTGSGKLDVGIYDASLKKLGTTGQVSGVLDVGAKTMTLPEPVDLHGGAVYYAAFCGKDVVDATILIGTTQVDAADIAGDTAGARELVSKTGAFPLPATVPVGTDPPTHAPILALFE